VKHAPHQRGRIQIAHGAHPEPAAGIEGQSKIVSEAAVASCPVR
jgi:hypothetical protein